jgi:hypothetical protein
MRITHFVSLALALATFGCKDKDGDGGSSAKTADKAAGPVKTTPQDLFAEFSPAGKLDGMALLDKYHDGATFTGTVKNIIVEESGKASVWIDAGGKNKISLEFKDPAKGKAAKVGDSITVTCKIGGESGALMMALDCT